MGHLPPFHGSQQAMGSVDGISGLSAVCGSVTAMLGQAVGWSQPFWVSQQAVGQYGMWSCSCGVLLCVPGLYLDL